MIDDDLPYVPEDAEIGRVEVYSPRQFKETIRCPEITFNRKIPTRHTMSKEQCMLRVYTQASCTKGCAIAIMLLEEWRSMN